MFRFENLEIWHLAVSFSEQVYDCTENFPKDELFTLTSQLRRAVVSVCANIAEGSGCDSRAEFARFLGYAIRSDVEVVAELNIAKHRKYISQAEFDSLYSKGELLIKKIKAFRNSL